MVARQLIPDEERRVYRSERLNREALGSAGRIGRARQVLAVQFRSAPGVPQSGTSSRARVPAPPLAGLSMCQAAEARSPIKNKTESSCKTRNLAFSRLAGMCQKKPNSAGTPGTLRRERRKIHTEIRRRP